MILPLADVERHWMAGEMNRAEVIYHVRTWMREEIDPTFLISPETLIRFLVAQIVALAMAQGRMPVLVGLEMVRAPRPAEALAVFGFCRALGGAHEEDAQVPSLYRLP